MLPLALLLLTLLQVGSQMEHALGSARMMLFGAVLQCRSTGHAVKGGGQALTGASSCLFVLLVLVGSHLVSACCSVRLLMVLDRCPG